MIRSITIPFVLLAACGSETPDPGGGGTGDDQTPPTGRAAVEAWISEGHYLAWACEADMHASRSPSPHGFNRICSNDLISANASGTAPWPQGAAAVKELFADASATTPNGYAVYLKQASDSANGANWYWYERIDANVIADGTGASGAARSICVGCHVGAGIDAEHTPTPGARDQVYTPVP